MPMLKDLCDLMNLDYIYKEFSSIGDLENLILQNIFSIVLLKSKVYHENIVGEYSHFVIVKDITNDYIIVNDPDQEFGGENKKVDRQKFVKAWNASNSKILVIRGEK